MSIYSIGSMSEQAPKVASPSDNDPKRQADVAGHAVAPSSKENLDGPEWDWQGERKGDIQTPAKGAEGGEAAADQTSSGAGGADAGAKLELLKAEARQILDRPGLTEGNRALITKLLQIPTAQQGGRRRRKSRGRRKPRRRKSRRPRKSRRRRR